MPNRRKIKCEKYQYLPWNRIKCSGMFSVQCSRATLNLNTPHKCVRTSRNRTGKPIHTHMGHRHKYTYATAVLSHCRVVVSCIRETWRAYRAERHTAHKGTTNTQHFLQRLKCQPLTHTHTHTNTRHFESVTISSWCGAHNGCHTIISYEERRIS